MKLRLLAPVALAVLAVALPVQAAVSLDLTQVFSGSAPAGSSSWLNATFSDGPAPNSVTLTLSAVGLITPEFVSDWYLNFNDTLNVANLKFAFDSADSTAPAATVSLGKDHFKADGDGFYDILLSFPTPKKNRFDAGEVAKYTITSVPDQAFDAASFEFWSTPKKGDVEGKNIWKSAAHVQGGDGGWIGAGPTVPPPPAVPEPLSLVIWSALATLGVAVRMFRRA